MHVLLVVLSLRRLYRLSSSLRNCTVEARRTAGVYDNRLVYGSHYIFCSATVSVFHEIDNFLNGDYNLLHDYVIELNVIFGTCDTFFYHCALSSWIAITLYPQVR